MLTKHPVLLLSVQQKVGVKETCYFHFKLLINTNKYMKKGTNTDSQTNKNKNIVIKILYYVLS